MKKFRIVIITTLLPAFSSFTAAKPIPARPAQTKTRTAASVDAAPGAQTSPKNQIAPENPTSQPPAEPKSERFTLDNGLTVLLRPIHGARSICLTVLYSIGSDHDPLGHSGLAHLTEHLYVTSAAGQQKPRTYEEFARRYTQGANAQTGFRHTVVATVFPSGELDAELQDAAARMGDLQIAHADLDRERPRILEEVDNMFEALPMLAALNNARQLLRPTPSGGRHGGSPDHLRAITIEEVKTHWRRFYKPQNAIIVLAGDIDSVSARDQINRHFARIPAGEKVPEPRDPDPPSFGARLDVKSKAVDDAPSIACVAYPAPPPDSDLYAPSLVLISRLWAASSKLGNTGPTGSPVYFAPLDDGSIVAISTAAKPGETSAQAFARIEAFVKNSLSPNRRLFEIATTRQQFSYLLFSQNLPENALAGNVYGAAYSLGRRYQLHIKAAALDKTLSSVTDQDLRRAAEQIFAPSRSAAVFVSR